LTLALSKLSSPPQTEHKPAIYTGNNFAELLTDSGSERHAYSKISYIVIDIASKLL